MFVTRTHGTPAYDGTLLTFPSEPGVRRMDCVMFSLSQKNPPYCLTTGACWHFLPSKRKVGCLTQDCGACDTIHLGGALLSSDSKFVD